METMSTKSDQETKSNISSDAHSDKSRSFMSHIRHSLFASLKLPDSDRRLSSISVLSQGRGRQLLHSRGGSTPLVFAAGRIVNLPAFRVDGPLEKELRRRLPTSLYLELTLCMGHPGLFPGDSAYTQSMPWPAYDPVACSEQYAERVDGNPVLRAATLNGVIHHLACQGATDNELLEDFLRTYHYCATGRDLLRMVFARYLNCLLSGHCDQWASIIKLKLVNFIKKWVNGYCSVLRGSPPLLSFVQAVLRFMGDAEPNRRPFVDAILDDLTSPVPVDEPVSALGGLSEMLDREVLRPASLAVRFVDIKPRLLAQQLTHMEYSLFCAIQPEEVYHQAWSDKLHRESTSPHLWAFIQMFDRVANFVTMQVTDPPDPSAQATVISHAIRLARQCVKLNNFNSAFEIMASLNGAPVAKLGRAWQHLPARDRRAHHKLKQLLSTSDNYKAYRDALRADPLPTLPFVGVALTDLVFAENGNPTYFKLGAKSLPTTCHFPSPAVPYINLAKFRLMANIMAQLLDYQLVPYQLEADAPTQAWILHHMLLPSPSPKHPSAFV
ncbi:hypothetical protein L0F63_006727, partial [Massospora cicadina]